MGYESKLYICQRREFDDGFIFGQPIASYDLGKFYVDGWRELFKTPIDFDISGMQTISIPDSKDSTKLVEVKRGDMYGKHCKYTSPVKVLNFLISKRLTYKEVFHNPRVSIFVDTLKLFVAQYPEDSIVVVHYGY